MEKFLLLACFACFLFLFSGVFALFPGDYRFLHHFDGCDYLYVSVDANVFSFPNCRDVGLGYKWRCDCVNRSFDLSVVVNKDASPGFFTVSSGIEVVSHSMGGRCESRESQPIMIVWSDFNAVKQDLNVVKDCNLDCEPVVVRDLNALMECKSGLVVDRGKLADLNARLAVLARGSEWLAWRNSVLSSQLEAKELAHVRLVSFLTLGFCLLQLLVLMQVWTRRGGKGEVRA